MYTDKMKKKNYINFRILLVVTVRESVTAVRIDWRPDGTSSRNAPAVRSALLWSPHPQAVRAGQPDFPPTAQNSKQKKQTNITIQGKESLLSK